MPGGKSSALRQELLGGNFGWIDHRRVPTLEEADSRSRSALSNRRWSDRGSVCWPDDPARISTSDVSKTGHDSAEDIRTQLRGDQSWPTFRIEFRILDEPDPRQVLANSADLDSSDVAEINRRLDRLDGASKRGPWTRQTMELIAKHPEVRAPDLAEMVGRETQPFKLDVRKLKNLGLTLSFNPGYRLSPRGEAFRKISAMAGEPGDGSANDG